MDQAMNIGDETDAGSPLPVGTKLSGDQFTITAQLGAGGFGITYKAMDNVLGREVVLKECFSQDFCYRVGKDVFARSANFEKQFRSIVEMFMREARSLARLRHPNIVGVHRAFEENATAYMALDLIDGADLFDVLGRSGKALPADALTEILMKLLDAIEKVHELDLLHRDISPDNIVIENTGSPVLIDFGAARADASRRTRAISSLLVVKDGYSPQEFYIPGSEQAPCSDLYALAATFYHAISGEPPINSQSRMIEVAGNRPDPCEPLAGRFPDYEPVFLQAIDQAMQVHPCDRIQSAAEWRAMIEPAFAGFDAPSPTAAPANILESISISELVESTNDEVRKTRIIEAKEEPKPKPVEKVESKIPDWVEEFNKEALEDDEPEPAPEPSVVVKPARTRVVTPDPIATPNRVSQTIRTERPPSGKSQAAAALERQISSPKRTSQRLQSSMPLSAAEKAGPETDWVNRAKVKQQTRLIGVEDADTLHTAVANPTRVVSATPTELRFVPPAPSEPSFKDLLGPMVKMLLIGISIGFFIILGIYWFYPDLLQGVL